MGFVCFLPFFVVLALFAVGLIFCAFAAISRSGSMNLAQGLRLWAKLLGMMLFVVGMFMWFVGHAICLSYGGYTHDGKIENGRYYLECKGDYTIVSKETWDYLVGVEATFGDRWWFVSAFGMMLFLVLGFYEKGRIVTNVADALDISDGPPSMDDG